MASPTLRSQLCQGTAKPELFKAEKRQRSDGTAMIDDAMPWQSKSELTLQQLVSRAGWSASSGRRNARFLCKFLQADQEFS